MKQKLLKTIVLGLMFVGGVNMAWAGDFIDDASSITVKQDGTTMTITTPVLSSGKKTISFTSCSTANKEFEVDFTFDGDGKALGTGQVFGVVEFSANPNNSRHRIRKLTLEGTQYEDNDNSIFTYSNGDNTVYIFSTLQKTSTEQITSGKGLINAFTANVDKTSMKLTNVISYFASGSENTTTTVVRIGMYTLGEIIELYPGLKTRNWEIYTYNLDGNSKRQNEFRLLNEGATNTVSGSQNNDGQTTGWIETHKNGMPFTTLAECKLFVKALGLDKLPDNYRNFWLSWLRPESSTTLDLFDDMNDNATLMLCFGANSTPYAMSKMPTKHKKLIDQGRDMFNYTFVDGTAPIDCEKVNPLNKTGNWGTYSRELKKGYNSCLMPFKKLVNIGAVPTGVTFYKLATTPLSDGKVVFTKIDDPSANNTFTNGTTWYPVVIKAETDGVYTFVGRDVVLSDGNLSGYSGYKSSTIDENLYWVGSFMKEAPMGSGKNYENYTACYGINSDGDKFLKMKSNTNTTYYRAFIADQRPATARALSLSFDDGNGTTEIVSLKDVHGMEPVADGAIYNLQGVRMQGDNLPRGIYVKNGKKFVVK